MGKVTERDVCNAAQLVIEDKTTSKRAKQWAKSMLQVHGQELQIECVYLMKELETWSHPQAEYILSALERFSTYVNARS